ncbi:hypothetical protein PGTUg99_002905 [Puccinia graminis f. sp. tritici]|uniref:Uncharacterized protein n=1 Tax=Puccinia graminis f. sp. tritici TaxID=56615 RepID=A0A5B0PCZ5_PUCGR|nr:hypothetical protein PGTUg99_002905 [Puccinia graminis f. sp. tritici]
MLVRLNHGMESNQELSRILVKERSAQSLHQCSPGLLSSDPGLDSQQLPASFNVVHTPSQTNRHAINQQESDEHRITIDNAASPKEPQSAGERSRGLVWPNDNSVRALQDGSRVESQQIEAKPDKDCKVLKGSAIMLSCLIVVALCWYGIFRFVTR